MDKNQIAILAHKMETKEDLLNLLNHIKHEDMVDMGFADKYHPFTMRHINYFCNPNNAFHRYRQFKIKKKLVDSAKLLRLGKGVSCSYLLM